MLHANFMAVCFMEPGRLRENRFLTLFAAVTLTLWPDLYSLQIHRMCKYELPTSRLSKVIVWHTCIHQTDTTKIIYHATLRLARSLFNLIAICNTHIWMLMKRHKELFCQRDYWTTRLRQLLLLLVGRPVKQAPPHTVYLWNQRRLKSILAACMV